MFFEEVFPNPVPLVIAQAEHNRTYRDGIHPVNYFEIGSSFLREPSQTAPCAQPSLSLLPLNRDVHDIALAVHEEKSEIGG